MAKSNIMSILKILTDICANAKHKNKKHFCKYCLHCFISERVLIQHKETSLWINSKQTVRLNKTISYAI